MIELIPSKPPIGLIPEKLWEQERIVMLSDAIHRSIEEGSFTPNLIIWIEELQKRLGIFV
jgi:hypothetical protein